MYKLMDRVEDGIEPMLECLDTHIVSTGLADMKAHAETITTVSFVYVASDCVGVMCVGVATGFGEVH